MCVNSQILQVWIKWPNLFGIYWAVIQGHVHSGMSLSKADAASVRFAKGPWMGFLVGVMGSQSPLSTHLPILLTTGFTSIMNCNRNSNFHFHLESSQIAIPHLVYSHKFKRLKIAAQRQWTILFPGGKELALPNELYSNAQCPLIVYYILALWTWKRQLCNVCLLIENNHLSCTVLHTSQACHSHIQQLLIVVLPFNGNLS